MTSPNTDCDHLISSLNKTDIQNAKRFVSDLIEAHEGKHHYSLNAVEEACVSFITESVNLAGIQYGLNQKTRIELHFAGNYQRYLSRLNEAAQIAYDAEKKLIDEGKTPDLVTMGVVAVSRHFLGGSIQHFSYEAE